MSIVDPLPFDPQQAQGGRPEAHDHAYPRGYSHPAQDHASAAKEQAHAGELQQTYQTPSDNNGAFPYTTRVGEKRPPATQVAVGGRVEVA